MSENNAVGDFLKTLTATTRLTGLNFSKSTSRTFRDLFYFKNYINNFDPSEFTLNNILNSKIILDFKNYDKKSFAEEITINNGKLSKSYYDEYGVLFRKFEKEKSRIKLNDKGVIEEIDEQALKELQLEIVNFLKEKLMFLSKPIKYNKPIEVVDVKGSWNKKKKASEAEVMSVMESHITQVFLKEKEISLDNNSLKIVVEYLNVFDIVNDALIRKEWLQMCWRD